MKWLLAICLLGGCVAARQSDITSFESHIIWVQYRNEKGVEDHLLSLLQGLTIRQQRLSNSDLELSEIEVDYVSDKKPDAFSKLLQQTEGVTDVRIFP